MIIRKGANEFKYTREFLDCLVWRGSACKARPYAAGFLGLWDKTRKIFDSVRDNSHGEGDGRVPLASAMLENVGDIRYVHGGLTNIPAVCEDVFRCLTNKAM
jgi:hypothetical protein